MLLDPLHEDNCIANRKHVPRFDRCFALYVFTCSTHRPQSVGNGQYYINKKSRCFPTGFLATPSSSRALRTQQHQLHLWAKHGTHLALATGPIDRYGLYKWKSILQLVSTSLQLVLNSSAALLQVSLELSLGAGHGSNGAG